MIAISTLQSFPFFKSKLAKRLSLYIFAITVATALLVTALHVVWEFHHEKELLRKEFRQVEKVNLPSIKANLWILDIPALQTILGGLLHNRNFVYFKLTDDQGKRLLEVGKLPRKNFLLEKIPLYHDNGYGKQIYIGTLTMVVTTRYIYENIIRNTLTTLGILLITMLLTVLFILFLVWSLISKHLLAIQSYTNKIRFEEEIPPLQLERKENQWTRDDALSSLVNAINKMQKMIRDSYARLEYQSLHDPLTDLPNLRSLRLDLSQRIKECEISGNIAALYFIDLDSFKILNDSLGHTVGDAALTEVAKRLKRLENRGVRVYRIGGDEFLLLTKALSNNPEKTRELAQKLAEEIRGIFDEKFELDGKSFKITAGIGVKLFQKGQDIETIIKHADNALYKAKEKNRNVIAFFHECMQSSTDKKLEIEQYLHHAIHNDEFIVHYQPKYDRHRKLRSAEALTRLRRKDGRLIPPGEFIPYAEETGMILDIDHRIIPKVFKFVLENRSIMENAGMESIAINISPAQFMMADFVQFIVSEAKRFSIDPHFIILEITEETVVSNAEYAMETMLELKRHGFRFSIDDFGTGYSSLRYLMNFPPDELKIDKSFVDHIPENDRSVAIVRTIITLAKTLHLTVVAEGVEREEQFRTLYRYGCTLFQGYLFSRPLPEEEFLRLLTERGYASDRK